MARVESVVFRGVIFRRYPDAADRTARVYFVPGQAARSAGVGRLHQEIWKAAHGPIPPGHEIHHDDHDPLNNDLDNLVCLPTTEHREHHAGQPITPAQRAARQVNQRATAAWHGSPEGLAWHAVNGRAAWESAEVRTEHCRQCGQSFETRHRHEALYCSNACKTAARFASGVDDEDRTCEGCGRTFRINRYRRARSCSRTCAWTVRRRRVT